MSGDRDARDESGKSRKHSTIGARCRGGGRAAVRILMVTSMFPPYRGGGVSSHAHDLAVSLSGKGHEVWVLSNRKGKHRLSDEAGDAPPGLRVIFCENLLRMFLRYTKLARTEDFDLIHFHSFNTLAVAWLSQGGRVPRVFTMHSDTANYFASVRKWAPNHPAYRLLRLYERLAIRFTETTIAVSKGIETQARELGAGEVVYIPNAVDCDYWAPGEAKSDLGQSILVPRMLVPKNGVEVAIRSMRPILAAFPGTMMTIAGDGPLRESLTALAKRVARGHIQFLGEVERPAMRRLYREASLVMIPSIISSGVEEATSIAAIEAMACGRPVIASNIGGLPELIRSGESGLLVPDGDSEALAAAATTLLTDSELALRMGAAARRAVVEDFSVRRWTEQVLSAYSAALNARTSPIRLS